MTVKKIKNLTNSEDNIIKIIILPHPNLEYLKKIFNVNNLFQYITRKNHNLFHLHKKYITRSSQHTKSLIEITSYGNYLELLQAETHLILTCDSMIYFIKEGIF